MYSFEPTKIFCGLLHPFIIAQTVVLPIRRTALCDTQLFRLLEVKRKKKLKIPSISLKSFFAQTMSPEYIAALRVQSIVISIIRQPKERYFYIRIIHSLLLTHKRLDWLTQFDTLAMLQFNPPFARSIRIVHYTPGNCRGSQ